MQMASPPFMSAPPSRRRRREEEEYPDDFDMEDLQFGAPSLFELLVEHNIWAERQGGILNVEVGDDPVEIRRRAPPMPFLEAHRAANAEAAMRVAGFREGLLRAARGDKYHTARAVLDMKMRERGVSDPAELLRDGSITEEDYVNARNSDDLAYGDVSIAVRAALDHLRDHQDFINSNITSYNQRLHNLVQQAHRPEAMEQLLREALTGTSTRASNE